MKSDRKTIEERLRDALTVKTKMRELGLEIDDATGTLAALDATWTRDLNAFVRDGRCVSGRVWVAAAGRWLEYDWTTKAGRESVIRLKGTGGRR